MAAPLKTAIREANDHLAQLLARLAAQERVRGVA